MSTSSKPWVVVRQSLDRVEVGISHLWTGATAVSLSAAIMIGALGSTIKETAPFTLRAAIATGIAGSIITSIVIILVSLRTVLRADDSGLLVPSPRQAFDWSEIRELRWSADLDILWIVTADGTEHKADLSIFGSTVGRRGVEALLRFVAPRGVPTTSVVRPVAAADRLARYEVHLDTRGYRAWSGFLGVGIVVFVGYAIYAWIDGAPWGALFCAAWATACAVTARKLRRWAAEPPVVLKISSEGIWASPDRMDDRLRAWSRGGRRGFLAWSALAQIRTARFPNGSIFWFDSRDPDEKPVVVDMFEAADSEREFLAACRDRAGAAVGDGVWPGEEDIAPAGFASRRSTRRLKRR